jgi:hypothetical protein
MSRDRRKIARIVRRAQLERTLCVDFDGVIHKYSQGFKDGSIYDEPIEGAFDALMKLKEAGYTVVIHTARKPFESVQEWLKEKAASYPEIQKLEVTDRKLPSLAYIDDRAIRFTAWQDILNYFV